MNLTKYQVCINQASEQICIENLNLLTNRKLLLEMARKRVCESGYQYKKGKSRSKAFNSEGTSDTEGPSDSAPKRKKLGQDARLTRITEIQDKTKDLNDQIGYKQKRREAAINVRNYKECDKLTEEMSELKSQKRKLETELTLLTKKQQKSSWYYKTKSRDDSDKTKQSDSQDSLRSFMRSKSQSFGMDGASTSASSQSLQPSSPLLPVSSISHVSSREPLSATESSNTSRDDDTVILSSDEAADGSISVPTKGPLHSSSSNGQYFQ